MDASTRRSGTARFAGLALLVLSGAAHAGQISIYEDTGFSGADRHLNGDVADFARTGFASRGSSAIVVSGRWELCTEANFRGRCAIFTPGRYATLGGTLGGINSAREVGDREAREVGGREAREVGGREERSQSSDRSGRVVLYSQPNLRGKTLAVSGEVEDLARSGFNDAAESMVVNSGTWTMCRDAHFRGDCREFGPGRYNLNTIGFDHAISSLRPSDGRGAREPGRGAQRGGRGIELFSETNLRGQRVAFNRDVDDLADGSGFNDSTESLVVHSGTWELCSDARFGGNCVVFRPGNYPNLGRMTKQFSSARRVR